VKDEDVNMKGGRK